MKLSDIKPMQHCPKCGGDQIRRHSHYDAELALYDLSERCTVCKWSRTFVNVKAG